MRQSQNKSQTKDTKKKSHTPSSQEEKNSSAASQPKEAHTSKESTDTKITQETTKSQEIADEIKTLKSDLLYLRAEFDNYKKQSIKERSQLIKYGGQELAVALLDILDNVDRALGMEINRDTMESFKKGIQLTASEMESTLGRFGIHPIDCTNKAFDPSIHEAIGNEEDPHTTPGHITKVLKKPYKFHDKVIRTGQVIVAKEPKKVD